MGKYITAIEKIVVTGATFKNSAEREFSPSWINFFYGNNGTGKSTIARAIRDGQGLTWKDGNSPDSFNVLVYNKEFISNELKFDDETPLMPGVLTLGEENIETQRQIEAKQVEQGQLDTRIQASITERTKRQADKTARLTAFEKACWKVAGRYYNAFGGRKGDFQSATKCAQKVLRISPKNHDFDALFNLYRTATDADAKEYDILKLLDLSKLDGAENYPLLGQAIISTADNAYSRFWQSMDKAIDWVKQGHDRYTDYADGNCLYCARKLPDDFETQFAACFDSKYSEDCMKITSYMQKYAEYMNAFIETVQRYVSYIPQQGFGDFQAYKNQLSLLETTVAYNNQRIAAKVEKPSETVELRSVRETLETINALIAETNALFEKNNAIVNHRENQLIDCMVKVWETLAVELQDEKARYLSDDKDLDDAISNLNKGLEADRHALNVLNAEITRLSENLGGSLETVKKINALLEKSGFTGFTLREHEKIPDKYEVVRGDNTLAKGLSEGERHFIAFLYFYHLVQGAWKKKDLPKGKIVVIDDPVSSMDSGVLFIVGSLVRDMVDECFKDGKKHNIRQIYILTHNPYFHKDVSFHRISDYKKVSFFEVKKDEDNVSSVIPCVEECDNDDGAENFSPVQNSYTALWQEYKDAKLPTTLLSIISRIVKYHFIQLCSYGIDELRSKVLEHIGDDNSKKRIASEMLKYFYEPAIIQDMGDGIYYTADKNNDSYKDIFKIVFEAMGQGAHYQKMSGEIRGES